MPAYELSAPGIGIYVVNNGSGSEFGYVLIRFDRETFLLILMNIIAVKTQLKKPECPG